MGLETEDGGSHDSASPERVDNLAGGGIIPSGALDPVYEAKAKVLNQAVRESITGTRCLPQVSTNPAA
jgi:hypothetical protein